MGMEEILGKLIAKKLGKDFAEKLDLELDRLIGQASDKTDADARTELRGELLAQYRTLISLLRAKTPCRVKISADDLSVLEINGNKYDLDRVFSHNDRKATECRVAIEALFGDLQNISDDIGADIAYIEDALASN